MKLDARDTYAQQLATFYLLPAEQQTALLHWIGSEFLPDASPGARSTRYWARAMSAGAFPITPGQLAGAFRAAGYKLCWRANAWFPSYRLVDTYLRPNCWPVVSIPGQEHAAPRSTDDPGDVRRLSFAQRRCLLRWIDETFEEAIPGRRRQCTWTSSEIAAMFERGSGIPVTAGQVKGAMMLSCYWPIDRTARDWRFHRLAVRPRTPVREAQS